MKEKKVRLDLGKGRIRRVGALRRGTELWASSGGGREGGRWEGGCQALAVLRHRLSLARAISYRHKNTPHKPKLQLFSPSCRAYFLPETYRVRLPLVTKGARRRHF